MVAGAGTAGALAGVVAVLPIGRQEPAETAVAKPDAQQAGGYRLSEHVLRYYQTARI